MGLLLQQLVEKIDRVREVAGRHLQMFFKTTAHTVCNFSEKDALTALFLQEEETLTTGTFKHDQGIGYLPWRSADFVFSQILPFLNSKTYRSHIYRGLITCSGGLTESTMKAS